MPDYTVQRIICLQPSATSILDSVGELHRVVACTRYCQDICPHIPAGARIVADSWTAQAAEITSIAADLVIAAVPYQEKAVGEILKAGVRFLGLAPRTLADIYADVAVISGLVGASQRGESVIQNMQDEIEAVRTRTRSSLAVSVFCEEWGKPLISSQPWVAELVEAAGGAIVGEPGKQIDLTSVLDEDPEVLIAAWCGAGDRVPLEKIAAERGWQQTRAARAGRVYCIRDEFLNTPAPAPLLNGLHALAAAIHPEMFSAPRGLRQITENAHVVRG